MLFRARADADFLGWGVEPHAFERFPKLDPLVVVELNTSFVHLYRRVLERLKQPVDRVLFHLTLHDFVQAGTRLFLTKYFRGSMIDWSSTARYFVQTVESDVVTPADQLAEAPNAVAYLVLHSFFSMFDVPEDEIPFVAKPGHSPEIDLEAIQKL